MNAVTPGAGPALPAAGSSFYLGMRILPAAQRDAMYAVYGFCRAVDDIADAPGPRPGRLEALEAWRRDIEALFAGEVRANTTSLARPVQLFGLGKQDFHDVIDGMEMDIHADIQAPDWATLDVYCDRVASAVGRLSTRIFGLPDGDGQLLAHHLGRALQLTNILRDIDEDAAIRRLYLPREALVEAGMTDLTPAAVMAHPRLGEACVAVADRARTHFDEADRIMSRHPRRLVRAPRLMEAAYRSVLERTVKRGFEPPRQRVPTSKLRLVLALIRYGLV